jgi:hypothetical protein
MHNFSRGIIWTLTPVLVLVASLLRRIAWPALLWLAALSVLAARSAWKARWKSRDAVALLLRRSFAPSARPHSC